MKYYKVTLKNGDELYHESKNALSHQKLILEMQEEATLSPVEVDEIIDVQQIEEEEYEECMF